VVIIQRMPTSAGEASCAPRLKARQRADEKGARYGRPMLRPENWIRPASASPARVNAGAPGKRTRFVAERRGAERGVKSLFGGSQVEGCTPQ
jgi:hypothetical protein